MPLATDTLWLHFSFFGGLIAKAMGSSYDAANTMISYCPVEGDMEYSGGVVFDSNGWTITGTPCESSTLT